MQEKAYLLDSISQKKRSEASVENDSSSSGIFGYDEQV